jgi:hypothetical protein
MSEPKAGTQHRAILDYLRTGKSLTALEALDLCGCWRLSGRIYDLKHLGWPIKSEWYTTQEGKRVALYRLELAA